LGLDGRLALVDWEYAGNGTPEIDVALLASNFDLSGEQIDDFIAAYGRVDRAAVAQFAVAAAIREVLWCSVQLRHGEASPDLPDYAEKCAIRVVRMLA
jgi:thiamine kinase-like enzyme